MSRTRLLRGLVLAAIVAALLALAAGDVPVLSFLAKAALFLGLSALLLWAAVRFYQAFLWKVGRRLTFSYFLIGVVPIPMVLCLALGTTYVLSTFFLGHLYRDAVDGFVNELLDHAGDHLDAFALQGKPVDSDEGPFSFDYYRAGTRVGGAGLAPERWPAWMTAAPPGDENEEDRQLARFVTLDGESVTLAIAVEKGDLGVITTYTGRLGEAIAKRSGAWVVFEAEREPSEHTDEVTVQGETVRFQSDTERKLRKRERTDPERVAFFAAQSRGHRIWDHPAIFWPQFIGPLTSLASGEQESSQILARSYATPRTITQRLLARKSEYDKALWLGLGTVAAGLSLIYSVALLIALAMIFGLSRAVNRLSHATTAVQEGNFSFRIPVHRKDQLGVLQRSFNEMAVNLEGLVAAAAQKEILDKELAIAAELQESLLPCDLPQGETIEIATVFEPSAAIGGDYFDILRLDARRMAVFVADVSGHGLSSGLRMAMIKAALQILCEQEEQPEAILRRLDGLVRRHGGERFFVTATLSVLDLESGRLDLLNAGHPPTYLLRGGEVREIVLPSSPLGALGQDYVGLSLDLEPDDMVVWLSDGFIEATSDAGEVFGYERIIEALSGPAGSTAEVRDRLVAAVERFAGGRASDDRTLVALRYRAPAADAVTAGAAAAEAVGGAAAVTSGSSNPKAR